MRKSSYWLLTAAVAGATMVSYTSCSKDKDDDAQKQEQNSATNPVKGTDFEVVVSGNKVTITTSLNKSQMFVDFNGKEGIDMSSGTYSVNITNAGEYTGEFYFIDNGKEYRSEKFTVVIENTDLTVYETDFWKNLTGGINGTGKTWVLDYVEGLGGSKFGGPVFFYGLDDYDLMTEHATEGDSWNWTAGADNAGWTLGNPSAFGEETTGEMKIYFENNIPTIATKQLVGIDDADNKGIEGGTYSYIGDFKGTFEVSTDGKYDMVIANGGRVLVGGAWAQSQTQKQYWPTKKDDGTDAYTTDETKATGPAMDVPASIYAQSILLSYSNARIMSVTENTLQIGVVRRDLPWDGACLLVHNYVTKEYFEANKPVPNTSGEYDIFVNTDLNGWDQTPMATKVTETGVYSAEFTCGGDNFSNNGFFGVHVGQAKGKVTLELVSISVNEKDVEIKTDGVLYEEENSDVRISLFNSYNDSHKTIGDAFDHSEIKAGDVIKVTFKVTYTE
ncbi:MAG: hypothetical protein MJZ61_02155 [Bacteroidales bacterium]|nr:hypothetical protein [Bacteroidales bacterium]